MRFVLDHDLHIHSKLSLCSDDPEQSTENILKAAESDGLSAICLTDHYWDESVAGAWSWYAKQNTAHIREALPLPVHERIRFYFGAETEMTRDGRVAITRSMAECLDFVIVPTTHLHMESILPRHTSIGERRRVYLDRFYALAEADLPFEKVGLAHATCHLIVPGDFAGHIELISGVPSTAFQDVFQRLSALGLGIELNFDPLDYASDAYREILRPYQIAKECGAKFYFGSDAHTPEDLRKRKRRFETIAEDLFLEETDKFQPQGILLGGKA